MISTSKLYKALDGDLVIALADDDGDGSPDSGVLEAALAAAEEEVRSAVARAGYQPADALPALLEDVAVTTAIERLFERRREMLPGPWRERAERARTLLRSIGDGVVPLSEVARSTPLVSSTPDIVDEPPLHRRSTMRGL